MPRGLGTSVRGGNWEAGKSVTCIHLHTQKYRQYHDSGEDINLLTHTYTQYHTHMIHMHMHTYMKFKAIRSHSLVHKDKDPLAAAQMLTRWCRQFFPEARLGTCRNTFTVPLVWDWHPKSIKCGSHQISGTINATARSSLFAFPSQSQFPI
jgi:hypothetical protein